MNAIISAPSYGATGLWVNSLESQFGWSRTQLSIAFSLGQLEASIAGPVVGYLIDRFGGKKVCILGTCIIALGFIILSQTVPVTNSRESWADPAIFYLAYTTIILGGSFAGWIPMTVIINNWFNKRRSLAMGLGSVGFSIGTFSLVPVLALMINSDTVGWSNTSLVIALTMPLIIFMVVKVIKNSPEEVGLLPDGIVETSSQFQSQTLDKPSPKNSLDFSISEALREKVFWIIAFGHGSSAMMTAAMMVHLILAFMNQGLSIQASATMWGFAMAIAGASQLLGGLIGDRFHKPISICIFGCLQSIGVAFAVLVSTVPMAIVFGLIYGVGFGTRAPITTAMRGDYFGRKAFGKIMGISTLPMMVMSLITPIIAASLYDHSGNYFIAFPLIGAMGFCGSFLFLFCKKPLHPSEKHTLRKRYQPSQ